MALPRGMVRAKQPVEELMEEVGRRSFHAVGKIVADGLPPSGFVESEGWQAPTISRALTDHEAEVAAQIAVWIEGAAKALVVRLLSESVDSERQLIRAWADAKSEVRKLSKGLKSNDGRKLGAATNKEKAEQGREAWEQVVLTKRKKHPHVGKQAIYDFIANDIRSGKHDDIKQPWPSFETAKSWISARKAKNDVTTG